MSLGQFDLVRAEDHGQMAELRRVIAQGPVQENLARGVVQMVIAPDDMRDAHHSIVHHCAKVVGR